jgi:hypothetical protein
LSFGLGKIRRGPLSERTAPLRNEEPHTRSRMRARAQRANMRVEEGYLPSC